jgi:hypothetical protein
MVQNRKCIFPILQHFPRFLGRKYEKARSIFYGNSLASLISFIWMS